MSDSEEKEIMSMRDLLEFAMKNSGQSNSPPKPMTEERATFLREALAAHTVDIADELKRAIRQIHEFSGGDVSEIEYAVDSILHFVENMDFAINFVQLNGLDAISSFLTGTHEEGASVKICQLIGALAQNNPSVQKSMQKTIIPEKLVSLIKFTPEIELKTMSFHALSCYARNCGDSLGHFISIGGGEVLMMCLNSSPRLSAKAAFFLSSVAIENGQYLKSLFDPEGLLLGIISDLLDTGMLTISQNLVLPLELFLGTKCSLELQLRQRMSRSVDSISAKLLLKPEFYREQIESCGRIADVLKR